MTQLITGRMDVGISYTYFSINERESLLKFQAEELKQSEVARRGVQTGDSAQGSFFLYEKSVLWGSDSLRGRKPEVCTDLTPNLFRP